MLANTFSIEGNFLLETLEVEESHVQELFFERGWNDGLPIVPPTVERVQAMLQIASIGNDVTLGSVPQRDAVVTAEAVALSAVMAGCRPDYFPVVLAAVEAMLDPRFNAHVAITSTGGVGLCVIVSGPYAARIGMNSGHNVLGPGNRANSTIGRSVRLLATLALGAGAGLDGSSLGSPAKYSYCLSEQPPPDPWQPLRVDLGFQPDDTSVTVLGAEAPRQAANFTTHDPEKILLTVATALSCPAWNGVQKGCQAVVVLAPEHAGALVRAGWTRLRVREFLAEHTRLRPEEFAAAMAPYPTPPSRKPSAAHRAIDISEDDRDRNGPVLRVPG